MIVSERSPYLELHASGELCERARRALGLLEGRCRVCPRLCKVDRLADRVGLCRVGRHAVVASHFAHFGEEDCLRGRRGSGTIFFSGCNLRCVFCQNHDISWQLQGDRVTPQRLAGMMLELQAMGCHNINWVTPEHVVPQILEALPLAVDGGLRLPLVYNTSAYDSPESLALMDGDLVLGEDGMARRGLIVRHLVMPGLLEETEAILRFVADELGPDTYVNVMAQYYPAGRTGEFPEIDRHLYRSEFERALEGADALGLRRIDDRSRAAGRRAGPPPVKPPPNPPP